MPAPNPNADSAQQHNDFLVCIIFFLSGAAALIYEISWTRQIGLLFGHTVHAASIVLASYFFGMAIGNWLGAKWSSLASPLIGYSVAELVVAVWAFFVPALLEISESPAIAPWLSSSSLVWQTFARSVFSFLLLLPATIALGVMLPMMAEFFSRSNAVSRLKRSVSARISFAYALNTAGALVGVLLATFYLLVFVGVRNSSYLAAAISVACAFGAATFHRRELGVQWLEGENVQRPTPRGEYSVEQRSIPDARLLTLSFLSGFGTLALQVLYTRMFSLVFHNSTYTFGIVIAVFLASLAAGAGLASKLQRRFNCQSLLGVATAMGAIVTAASIIVFVWSTELKYFSCGETFATYMFGAIGVVTMVVAPPIICLGMMLPLVWSLAGSTHSAGRAVGTLTAINTVAAAIGALSASFFMLPVIGLWQSIVLIAVLFFIAGAWLLRIDNHLKTMSAFGVGLGVISALAISSPIDSEHDRTKYGERLVRRWNSAYGWIDVVQRVETGAFKIRQNLHYRFGTTGGNVREYRQAHIPLLLHEHPTDVLFMGLGTGLTAGGAVPHQEVKSIVAVELIPEVVEAARVLAEHNYRVVDHSKVEIHIDDARHDLLANDRKYDVIVSDLFVPWESETGYLYTVEHYQIASRRMKADGLFCQWLPLYQVGEREFELIANSFASVFPNTTLWWGQLQSRSPVIALIGTKSPINFDSIRIANRLHNLKQQVARIDPNIATPEYLSDLYIGDWKLQPSAMLNTDEHPRVEFLTPISNRNRQMIRGKALEKFYDNVLSKLPNDSVTFSGQGSDSAPAKRRARQRLILFSR